MSQVGDFPPATLREYALIADGERGALCGPHGDLVWMCAPRWHDDTVFAKLIGGEGCIRRDSARSVRLGWPIRTRADLAQPLGNRYREHHRVP